MHGRGVVWILLSVGAVAGGMALNFSEFIKGSAVTATNLLVTLGYVGVWLALLTAGRKKKSPGRLRFGLVFWGVTLLSSVTITYAHATGTILYWALPIWVLLVSPLYGIRFFIESILVFFAVVTMVSALLSLVFLISLRRAATP